MFNFLFPSKFPKGTPLDRTLVVGSSDSWCGRCDNPTINHEFCEHCRIAFLFMSNSSVFGSRREILRYNRRYAPNLLYIGSAAQSNDAPWILYTPHRASVWARLYFVYRQWRRDLPLDVLQRTYPGH